MAIPFVILAGVLALSWAHADEAVVCAQPQADTSSVKAVARVMAPFACVTEGLGQIDPALVSGLAEQDSGVKAVRILSKPASRTSSSVTYRIEPEQVLKPGQALYFAVPADLAGKPVFMVTLGHRQDPRTEKGWSEEKKWDEFPGLTSVQLHAPDLADGWRYWRGPASGADGSKFAEIGGSPEIEHLYEWRKYGHAGLRTGESSTEPLKVDAMRLVASGKDQVLVSELTLKVLPPSPDKTISRTFSPGTDLGDYETGHGRTFGGGQQFQGSFPGALVLGSGGADARELPAGWRVERGALHVPLPEGFRISNLELAVGDSHPDGIRNKDGGWGTSGWSRLSVALRKSDGRFDTLMDRENVPPEGVLSGTPQDPCYKTGAGDELVISASDDTAYLMGLRLGLLQAVEP